jgi:hypothetical protein
MAMKDTPPFITPKFYNTGTHHRSSAQPDITSRNSSSIRTEARRPVRPESDRVRMGLAARHTVRIEPAADGASRSRRCLTQPTTSESTSTTQPFPDRIVQPSELRRFTKAYGAGSRPTYRTPKHDVASQSCRQPAGGPLPSVVHQRRSDSHSTESADLANSLRYAHHAGKLSRKHQEPAMPIVNQNRSSATSHRKLRPWRMSHSR